MFLERVGPFFCRSLLQSTTTMSLLGAWLFERSSYFCSTLYHHQQCKKRKKQDLAG